MSHIPIARPKSPSPPPVPAALQAVRKSWSSRMSERYCDELARSSYAKDGYTWGFKIYRTVYAAGSDANFEKAMEVLLAFMRSECFDDAVRENDGDHSSDDGMTAEERDYYENLPPMSDEQWAEVINDKNHPLHRSFLEDSEQDEEEAPNGVQESE